MSNLFATIFKRELLIFSRSKNDWLVQILFFVIIVSIFPLGLAQDVNLLKNVAPGIIWVAILLSTLLSLDHNFKKDYAAGGYEDIILSIYPLSLIVFIKIFFHWLFTIVPLLCIIPILSLFYGLNISDITVIILTIILGSQALYFLGALGASLTMASSKSGLLIFVIILPLYTPVLILATQAIKYNMEALPYIGLLALLAAITIATMLLMPILISFVLRAVK